MSETELYSYCLEQARAVSSLYTGSSDDRVALVMKMDANRWYSQEPVFIGDTIRMRITKEAGKGILRFLRAYGLPCEEKIRLLLDDFRPVFPRTCLLIEGYFQNSAGPGWKKNPAVLQLIDHVLFNVSQLSRELQDMTEQDLHHLFQSSLPFLTVRAFQLLKELCGEAHPEFIRTWNYEPVPVEERRMDTSAYSISVCMELNYDLFNDQSFMKNRLVEKIRENARMASCLLFMATHFFTALRASDMCLLPYPAGELPGPEQALQVLDSSDRDREAAALTDQWVFQVNALAMTPHKTLRFSGMPRIQIHVPGLLKAPVGIMLAGSMLHYTEGRPLMAGPVLSSDLKNLFGKEAVDLLGGRAFSTRRANKAYLQGIEAFAGQEEGAFLPYHLATLARCHKGDLRSLSQTTDIYLRDQNFAGVLPGLALMHVFQRGPFSWVLVVLLEKYDREAFRALSLDSQTQVLNAFALDPIQAEHLCQAVISAGDRVSELVTAAFCGPLPVRERLDACLDQIEKDLAEGRPERRDCLLAAAGRPCVRRTGTCTGCPHEILTRVFVHSLMKEYVRIEKKTAAMKEGPDRDRLCAIFTQGVIPVFRELVLLYKHRYPDADQGPIRDIIRKEAVKTDHDHSNG